ncbi:hypothetical protein ACJDU8_24770 [Clostridium sp. WILCCON 0269]|uniref:Uncharacterized protein n=1 Tax=Candidatus Clostridium eludens TaxID=3381663 RepID=A0ABW8SRQ2_9CLOT
MNKKSVLITPDIIEECLYESLDSLERVIPHIEKTKKKSLKKSLK